MNPAERTASARRYRGEWRRALLAVGVVAVLVCLATANAVVRSSWQEVEDGVLWLSRPDGLVAEAVASGTAAAAAGIEPGDVLLDINGSPVGSHDDVLRLLHAASEGTRLDYRLLRAGAERLETVSLRPMPTVALPVYLVLAGVGLFGLLVGAAVRVRRPDHQATLHFFWLTVAFFGVFAFSFSGRLDRLDWVFFWADEVSILLVAPLFMHFALVFPERAPGWFRHRLGTAVVPLVYAPAALLASMQITTVLGADGGPGFALAIERVWRLQHVYLAACMIGGLGTMVVALRRVHSVTSRRQLRWVVSGALLGGIPFAFGYGIPYAMGFEPAVGFELTAVPLGLIPLTFASAIVRYRLHDVEVIVKRGVAYTAVVVAVMVIYLALEGLASEVFLDESDDHNAIIALLATAVVALLATPVKNAIQTMLDRVYYRDRFDYRQALVGFARALNGDLDLSRLSTRLVDRVAATFDVDRMVLFHRHRSDGDSPPPGHDYLPLRWTGFDGPPPSLRRDSSIGHRLTTRGVVSLDDPRHRQWCTPDDVAFWRRRGLYYFVPCVTEAATIAVLALGRKGSGEPLSSEDINLLVAVAGQVATALENGRLYGQVRQKARELDRMRQFSENIIESLSDGLVVLDFDDRALRWNAAFERLYGISRREAVGRSLDELFDAEFVGRLRRAREDTSDGSTLYRVPLTSRHAGAPQRLRVNAATAPLRTPGGETDGTLVIVEDTTARVQLEEQLQISEKMASIGLLAAGVAHEINTPLTGISSFTQMLLDEADPDDPKTRVLEKIERQSFRAAKIVNGLLNLSRPGRPDVAGPVDLNTIVNDVFALLEHQLETGRVKVRRELSTPSLMVHGVEFKMQQVFLNLFLNARDAMPTGGWLGVATRAEHGFACIEVSDTGRGIAPEHLSRIYDPFFTTKAVGQGTGLGLSVTYGVVQELGGTIDCDSQSGQGTRFTLTLPLAVSHRARSSGRS